MDCNLECELRDVLLNSAYRNLMNIRFEDNMIVCHKTCGSRIEFEKAVGCLIVSFSQRAKEFGFEVSGRNGAGICLGNGDLGLKIYKEG